MLPQFFDLQNMAKECDDMPKKNVPLTQGELMGRTYPKVHDGKRCYIDFMCYDPAAAKLKRKKYYIEDGLTVRERRKRASELVRVLTEKLDAGWNPWCDSSESRSYVEISTVLAKYEDYCNKFQRDKTRHSYASRLNILREYLSTMALPIKYAYQYDAAFVIGFLDYVYLDRECGARTRNNYLGWCSSLAQFMADRKYITSNFCSTIKKLVEDPKHREPLTASMLAELSSHLQTKDKHFLLACYFEYYTFIRPTELSWLTIGDISISEMSIFVGSEHSKNRHDAKVGLNKKIVNLMIDLGTFNNPSSHYLFSRGFRPGTTRVGPDQFNKRWATLRKQLKWGDEYQFYSLKDSGIRDLANASGIVIARDQARHEDVSTTNKYLRGKQSTPHKEASEFDGYL